MVDRVNLQLQALEERIYNHILQISKLIGARRLVLVKKKNSLVIGVSLVK